MQELLPLGARIGAVLKARGETIAIAESSTGGLISAALLSVPGASAYFVGGGVLYSRPAILALKDTRKEMFTGMRGGTEPWALMLARTMKERCSTVWGLGESGAAGPTGNRYGDPAGLTYIVVCGPVDRTLTINTGSSERVANMRAFSAAALKLLAEVLEA
ncbi:MAG TPA: CinA family protein [Burkholderiales bacterium]|nr:CinA family protein [Burkholderiales bacterium]